jgi:hypothetical protein
MDTSPEPMLRSQRERKGAVDDVVELDEDWTP